MPVLVEHPDYKGIHEKRAEINMTEHDFLTLDTMRATENPIAALYVLLFIPFWKFVSNSVPRAAEVHKEAAEPASAGSRFLPTSGCTPAMPGSRKPLTEWPPSVSTSSPIASSVPSPGSLSHNWLRRPQGRPGPLRPRRRQGIRSPLPHRRPGHRDQPQGSRKPRGTGKDPYGSAWLFHVKPAGFSDTIKSLFSGEKAHKFLDDAFEALLPTPTLAGAVAQDGGLPASGFARELSPRLGGSGSLPVPA